MPANLFALVAGGVASLVLKEWTPLIAAGVGSGAYLALLSLMPSFRRAVRANLNAQSGADVATPEERGQLLSELAPSQRDHYEQLAALKARILESYAKIPVGVSWRWPRAAA